MRGNKISNKIALNDQYLKKLDLSREHLLQVMKCVGSNIEVENNLFTSLLAFRKTIFPETDCHWYHSDHLGSSSWITYTDGAAVQHLHYLPWGESFVDQRVNSYAGARYTFSAKEKDTETGYSYFGARYYSSDLSIWLSVDPMSDKYPSLSPYTYCADNPIKLVDPNGREYSIPPFLYHGVAMAMEFFGKSSKVRQAGYAMQHPINAIKVGSYNPRKNNISTIASNFQINITRAAGLSCGHEGDQGNAIRHALWQSMITNEMGYKHAKRIGDSHEDNLSVDVSQRVFENLGDADKVVDLLNNEIGRTIGNQNKGADNQTIAKKVIEEFHINGLWTASQTKDGKIVIQKNRITKSQYEAAILEINKKGTNGLNL